MSPVLQRAAADNLVLLEDSRQKVGDNLMFWAADAKGYTSDVAKAHLFTEEEAMAQHASRPTDVPWHAGYLADKIRPVVDFQLLLNPGRYEQYRQGRPSQDDELYFLSRRSGDRVQTIGNDVLFSSREAGRNTTNLNGAMSFQRDQIEWTARHSPKSLWPADFVMSLSRMAVNANWVDRSMSMNSATRPQPSASRPRS